MAATIARWWKRVRAVRRVALLAPLLLSACSLDILDPAGIVGRQEMTILVDSVVMMLALVVPTILAILAFAWWFRESNSRARRLPHWAHSGQIELLVWGVPLLMIMLLSGVAWIGSHELDPATPIMTQIKPLEIQAVSLDWKWLFIYPDKRVASVNMLEVPAGVPLHFSLTSASVMNAFFVPRLGSMIYTMNGMTTRLYLAADAPGDFRGQSSHFSGDGFSDMHFNVHAVPQDQFDAWVEQTRRSGPMLDAAGYRKLEDQSTAVAPMTYRDVDPTLFQKIVTLAIPPGPGPLNGPTVSPRSEAAAGG